MKVLRWLFSFLLGCAVGVVLHDALCRRSLPVEPFMYMTY